MKTSVNTEAGAEWAKSSDSLRIGMHAGPWVIEGELGRGGMGVVYAVKHSRIGKRAALKVLQRRLPDRQRNAERMLVEAQVVNAIGHPNIVDIFDVGATEDGRPYIVMEQLAGRSLAEVELGVDEALAILIQVADALIAAHDAGVVHRDLKPENIFLVETGPEPRVKLLDWGIARMMHADARQTIEGQVVGTPRYISPEQARGEPVTPKTDVYSFGVVAYEVVLLQPPFIAKTSSELVAMHLLAAPRDPRSLWPEIPEPLELLLNGMLAKHPAARPTMREVASQLARARDEIDAARRPVPFATEAVHAHTRRWPIGAGVLALSAIAALFWIARRDEAEVTPMPGEGPPAVATPSHPEPTIPALANPVIEDCADPSVARVNSRWYLTCTGGRGGNLYPIHESSDLQTWRAVGWIFPAGARPAWASGNYWAPELHAAPSGFAAYFSMREAGARNAIGVASATAITGPYRDRGAPLVAPPRGASDAHLLASGDHRYLYYKDEKRPASIWVQPLASDGTTPRGQPQRVLAASEAWERGNLEGPAVVHAGDYFYLFYSGARYCDADYVIGVARARSPLGPFEKYPRPLVQRDRDAVGPGHPAIVDGPDGTRYLAYHAYRAAEGIPSCDSSRNQRRHVWIEPLVFEDGWPTLVTRR